MLNVQAHAKRNAGATRPLDRGALHDRAVLKEIRLPSLSLRRFNSETIRCVLFSNWRRQLQDDTIRLVASTPKRRRSSSHRAILAATRELIAQQGYGRLTIEGIAARAGVGKQTIYRWWPSKGAVAIEALLDEVQPDIEFPSTGDFRADLEAVLGSVARLLADPRTGPPLTALLAETQHDEALEQKSAGGVISSHPRPLPRTRRRRPRGGRPPRRRHRRGDPRLRLRAPLVPRTHSPREHEPSLREDGRPNRLRWRPRAPTARDGIAA